MTIDEIVEVAGMASQDRPLGDPYLDGLFDLADTAIYYRFIYHLMRRMRPKLVVELGVCTGRCTAHMAAAEPECTVLAVDPAPQRSALDVARKFKNIDLVMLESTSPLVLAMVIDKSVDICFVDTVHTREQVMAEFFAWKPKMKPGGVMLFDDISENSSMVEAWSELCNNGLCAVSLPHLHHSGFGAVAV